MISKYDNCLFVHVPKVAGQSVESVFLERAGLTWKQRDAMLLKHNSNPSLGPPRLAHLTAQEYVKYGYLSPEEFAQLFSFAFVRNPWDRLVSEYIYRKYPYSFKEFLVMFFPTHQHDNYIQGLDLYRHVLPQTDFLCDDKGDVLVDFVGKFENLVQDFSKVTKLITGQSLTLPHKNKTSQKRLQQLVKLVNKNKTHYSEFYDEESRMLVAKLYQRDIEIFGYVFEQH